MKSMVEGMSLWERDKFDRSFAAIAIGDDIERVIEATNRREAIPEHEERVYAQIDGMTVAEIHAMAEPLLAKQKAQLAELRAKRDAEHAGKRTNPFRTQAPPGK